MRARQMALAGVGLALIAWARTSCGVEPAEAATWQAELKRRAARIQPTAAELRWLEIPWVASADKAIERAKAERRPLFLFSVDGDPFDRC